MSWRRTDFEGYEDEQHDAAVVEFLDDWNEALAEQAGRQDAFLDGQRAGHASRSAGLNPWEPGTAYHAEWERGRSAVTGYRLMLGGGFA